MSVRAIRGATVIDCTGRDPLPNMTVLIQQGRIAEVGPDREVHVPRDAVTIDAAGRTMLPGLIDCHVHVTVSAVDYLHRLMTPPSLRILQAVPNLRATLEAGFTTVRDAGGAPLGMKMALERGMISGPRMEISITMVSQTGGHGDSLTRACVHVPLFADIPDIPNGVADGAEEVRKKVREILAAGADWIKLATSGGVLSQTDTPSAAQLTVEEIRAAVYEADADGGKQCMAHAQATRGIKHAIEGGVKSIEHGIFLDEETIAMMKDRDVYLVPTLVAPMQILRQAEHNPGSMPPWAVERTRSIMAQHHASFRHAVEAGVKVAMGTDSGVGPHGENAEELAVMVQHGMSPMTAILASTSWAAELLRMQDRLGTIESGKLADLVLIDGDPLDDIRILQDRRRVHLVMKDGFVFKGVIDGAHVGEIPRDGHEAPRSAPATVESGRDPTEHRVTQRAH